MLDIQIELVGLTLAVFLILIAVLNSLLYKPLFNFMNKRETDIQNDLNLVGNNDAEILALMLEAEQIVTDAKLAAAAEREKTITEAKQVANGKVETKRAELAKAYQAFEVSLAEERTSLKNTLLSQMPLFKEAVKAKFSQI